MNCPYCGRQMVAGFVQSGREVFFTESRHKLLFASKKDEITLTKNNLTAPTCHAWHCQECRVVIMKYELE